MAASVVALARSKKADTHNGHYSGAAAIKHIYLRNLAALTSGAPNTYLPTWGS